ncbi:MAG TPA: DUF3710 domain-containing protein, partial [Nocardioidaceae bacterium]|nr:DUF3710 domain-containing protein [Nocardioidaceae bacterium]
VRFNRLIRVRRRPGGCPVIFRRKRDKDDADDGVVDDLDDAGVEGSGDDLDELETARPRGPWDRSETDADTDGEGYIDLGGLVVRGSAGLELRLQVDEQAQEVSSVMLAAPDSGVELRAFAAPRYDGIWDEVRHDIAAEATKRGGTASERDGEFGVELTLVVPVQTPDGKQATQTSRIVGVDGPRWLLRGTFLGKSATQPDPEGAVESAFRDVIVVRGNGPMAPRDLIPMTVPQMDPDHDHDHDHDHAAEPEDVVDDDE